MTTTRTAVTDGTPLASGARGGEAPGTSPDGVIALDGDWRITGLDAAAERLLESRAEEVVGRDLAQALLPERVRKRSRLRPALDRRIELTAVRADGLEIPIELTVTALRGTAPSAAGLIARVHDLTGRDRAEGDLRASRRRIVVAADAARRRVARDLHDGAERRLAELAALLRRSRERAADPESQALLDEAIGQALAVTATLHELVGDVHPAALSEGGLMAALVPIAERSPVPVVLARIPERRFPPSVEATAYFVCSEALTNVVRHADARRAVVTIAEDADVLRVEIRDDGRGGADAGWGAGLRGLQDRVTAFDGTLVVESPPAGGTLVRAELPRCW